MKLFARILLTSAMLAGSTSAMAACPVGEYVAAGWNPGTDMEGPANYRAAVEISDRGANVCNIEWDLGGQHFAAVGFFDPSTNELNASYANIEAGWFGIISYRLANGRLDGEWAIYNSGTNQRGREILTRR